MIRISIIILIIKYIFIVDLIGDINIDTFLTNLVKLRNWLVLKLRITFFFMTESKDRGLLANPQIRFFLTERVASLAYCYYKKKYY